MNSDPSNDGESRDALHWLDGLAGRPGAGDAHAEGAQLRESLSATAPLDMPAWSDIERLAGVAPQAHVVETDRVGTNGKSAANQASWKPWSAAAAVLVVATAAITSLWTDPVESPAPVMRGGTSSATNVGPVWKVARPQEAAAALAVELVALGAQVEVVSASNGATLNISAQPAASRAVNERLAELEAALDASGHLTLTVIAAP